MRIQQIFELLAIILGTGCFALLIRECQTGLGMAWKRYQKGKLWEQLTEQYFRKGK